MCFGGRELIFHEAKQNNAEVCVGGNKLYENKAQIVCHKEIEPVWEKLQKEYILRCLHTPAKHLSNDQLKDLADKV